MLIYIYFCKFFKQSINNLSSKKLKKKYSNIIQLKLICNSIKKFNKNNLNKFKNIKQLLNKTIYFDIIQEATNYFFNINNINNIQMFSNKLIDNYLLLFSQLYNNVSLVTNNNELIDLNASIYLNNFLSNNLSKSKFI